MVRMPTHWASRNLNGWQKQLEAAVKAASKAALAGEPNITDLFKEHEKKKATKRKVPAGKGKGKRKARRK